MLKIIINKKDLIKRKNDEFTWLEVKSIFEDWFFTKNYEDSITFRYDKDEKD